MSMDFKERFKKARLEKNLSQGKLADLVGVHVTNISRYERGEHKPATDMLSKLADALGVTSDFLMVGSTDDIAKTSISDKDLLAQFQKVEKFPHEKKMIIKELLDAFILKTNLQQQLAI